MLHTELINSFPSSTKESIKIEIGVIVDSFIRKPTETFNLTLDKNQYVAFIEDIIDRVDHVPKIKIIYRFGNPCVIDVNKIVMYEKNYIEIEFL